MHFFAKCLMARMYDTIEQQQKYLSIDGLSHRDPSEAMSNRFQFK